MSQYLKMQMIVVACCSGIFSSCGEKDTSSEKVDKETPTELPAAPDILIQHTHDGRTDKSGKQQSYKITAEIYDAKALPLGEIYNSREQLDGSAVKLAELVNLLNSGDLAKMDEKDCQFNTEAFTDELVSFMDVSTELKFRDVEMKFRTTLKFNYPVFYEMSMAGKPDRLFVMIIGAETLPLEK